MDRASLQSDLPEPVIVRQDWPFDRCDPGACADDDKDDD